jgi:hypothetical protein
MKISSYDSPLLLIDLGIGWLNAITSLAQNKKFAMCFSAHFIFYVCFLDAEKATRAELGLLMAGTTSEVHIEASSEVPG